MLLSDLLRTYRNENDITLEEFARKIGTTKQYVWQLEKGDNGHGKRAKPSMNRLGKIADAMGLSLAELLDKIDDYSVTPAAVDYVQAGSEEIIDNIDGSVVYTTDEKTNALASMMLFLSRLTPYQINKLHRIGEVVFSDDIPSDRK